MIVETINIVKHGVVIRQFPCSDYILSHLNGVPTLLFKDTRTTAVIPSPNVYDYIEIEREEVENV